MREVELIRQLDQIITARLEQSSELMMSVLLNDPQVLWVDEEDNLVIGASAGADNIPASTLGKDYHACKRAAQDAGLHLLTLSEFRALGPQDQRYITWLDSGENPEKALCAKWTDGKLQTKRINATSSDPNLGACNVIKIKLTSDAADEWRGVSLPVPLKKMRSYGQEAPAKENMQAKPTLHGNEGRGAFAKISPLKAFRNAIIFIFGAWAVQGVIVTVIESDFSCVMVKDDVTHEGATEDSFTPPVDFYSATRSTWVALDASHLSMEGVSVLLRQCKGSSKYSNAHNELTGEMRYIVRCMNGEQSGNIIEELPFTNPFNMPSYKLKSDWDVAYAYNNGGNYLFEDIPKFDAEFFKEENFNPIVICAKFPDGYYMSPCVHWNSVHGH